MKLYKSMLQQIYTTSLTKKELDTLIYLTQIQDDFGFIVNVHWNEIANQIGMVAQSFYNAIYGLESKGFLSMSNSCLDGTRNFRGMHTIRLLVPTAPEEVSHQDGIVNEAQLMPHQDEVISEAQLMLLQDGVVNDTQLMLLQDGGLLAKPNLHCLETRLLAKLSLCYLKTALLTKPNLHCLKTALSAKPNLENILRLAVHISM